MRDLAIDDVEPSIDPEALLDGPKDQGVGAFGEHGVTARSDRVKVHAETAMPPLKRWTEETIDSRTPTDGRQRHVRVHHVVCEQRERLVELPRLEGQQERPDDLGGRSCALSLVGCGGADRPSLRVLAQICCSGPVTMADQPGRSEAAGFKGARLTPGAPAMMLFSSEGRARCLALSPRQRNTGAIWILPRAYRRGGAWHMNDRSR